MEISCEIRPNTIKNKHTNSKFKFIFDTWLEVIQEYCAFANYEDSPYIYNERATLSSFVGALWKSNELVLEEFSAIKGGEDEGDEKTKKGRIDLWFTCNKENFISECKQYWYAPTYTNIEGMIKNAIMDTNKSKKYYEDSTPLAITFWSPFFTSLEKIETNLHLLQNTLEASISSETIDMYCIVAPKKARNLEAGNGKYYPCVVLLGKFC